MKKFFLTSLQAFLVLVLAYAGGHEIGDKASGFKLKNVDGKMVSLLDYDDAKGVVVIFTCNHCPYAIAYQDRIIDLDKKYKEKGFPVVAINPNDPEVVPGDSYENMQKRAKEKGYTFPYLFDAEQTVFKAYGATRTPHVFLLKNTGDAFVVKYIGTIDNSAKAPDQVSETYLADAIDALLDGKDPDPNITKAIGCSIKVKKEE